MPVRGGRRAANLVTQDDLHDAYAVVAGVDVHGGGVVGGAVADAAGVQEEAAGAASEDETQEDAGIGKAVVITSHMARHGLGKTSTLKIW